MSRRKNKDLAARPKLNPVPRPAELLGYLKDHPGGVLRTDICRDLNMSETTFRESLLRLQMTLGKEKDFNVIAVPLPKRHGLCMYRIAQAMDVDAQAFYDKETRYVVTRVQKIQAVLSSLIRSTDGRTRSGKVVRILHRHVTRALEDIVEV